MNFPLLSLFTAIIEAVRSGEYRAAVCAAGKLLTSVACQPLAELAANARPHLAGGPQAVPLTESELYEACVSFCDELEAETNRTSRICGAGEASDATLTPIEWIGLAKLVIDLLRRFIKKPANFVPKLAAIPSGAPLNIEGATLTLPKMSVPPREIPAENPASEPASDEEGDEEGDGEPEAPQPPPKPKPKKG